jgi:hypothetical protein
LTARADRAAFGSFGKPREIPFGSFGKPEKYEECAIEPDEIGIGQTAEMIAYICPRHRGDLVDHDVAWLLNSCHRRRLHSDSGQRRLDRIGCQWTDRD